MLKKCYWTAALLCAALTAGAYGSVLHWKPAYAGERKAETEVTDGSRYAVIVNGAGLKLDTPARLEGSTLLVPVRGIAEALGAKVSYDGETGAVTAEEDGTSVTFRAGSADALCNGVPVTLDTPVVKDGDYTMVPLRFFSETFGSVVKWDGANHLVTIDSESRLLPAVGSYANLKKLVKEQEENYGSAYNGGIQTMKEKTIAPIEAGGASSQSAAQDYSATNVQTEGVDEADSVKTDGEYLYQATRDRILIAKAVPAGQLRIASSISSSDLKLIPVELYVEGNRLTVIGISGNSSAAVSPPGLLEKRNILRPLSTKVKTEIFDITSREQPKRVKEVETDGEYVTSRKIGSNLYVITNQPLDRQAILDENRQASAPAVRDSAVQDKPVPVDYSRIRYIPGSPMDSYMLISGIDTEQPEQPARVSVYLGSARDVYASEHNLYAAVQRYHPIPSVLGEGAEANAASTATRSSVYAGEMTTTVCKFLLNDGQVRFTAEGEIPGTVLNRYSMDENDGFFRIATTDNRTGADGSAVMVNQVYILDESLQQNGKLVDIAPGERIYSVRFMGNRGYVVTFRQVDPLFVLDLSDPASPTVLGKLKIPGYSDYLQPYDETHLIGFGKDAVPDKSGNTAYYLGMKLALFDVSDPVHPVQQFSTYIGGRGTDSEVLHNPKALLFSKERGLLAFPVTVMEVSPEAQEQQGSSAYGQFTFQGAYIYGLNLKDGFRLRGTITHLSEEERLKAGDGQYAGTRHIERIVYIGDTLYTLSPSKILAHSLDSLELKGKLELP